MPGRTVLVVAALATACSFDPDYGGTQYICKLERCPSGYVCIDEVCVTGASDAASDGAALDGPAPDGPVIDGGETPSCEAQFGAAEAYELCSETATTCTFDMFAGETSCDDQCELYGGTCVQAMDSDNGFPCVDSGNTACDAPHNYVICTCAR